SVVARRESSIVAILVGSTWIALDPATGRPSIGPIDLGFEPAGDEVQYADFDGDGEPEILAVGPGPGGKGQSLTALSIATGRPLWTGTMDARLVVPYDLAIRPGFPLLADLDGDGRAEVVVPDSGPLDPKNNY